VILTTNVLGARIDLDYNDRELYELAKAQQEARKAAAKEEKSRQSQEKLKEKF